MTTSWIMTLLCASDRAAAAGATSDENRLFPPSRLSKGDLGDSGLVLAVVWGHRELGDDDDDRVRCRGIEGDREAHSTEPLSLFGTDDRIGGNDLAD